MSSANMIFKNNVSNSFLSKSGAEFTTTDYIINIKVLILGVC